MPMMDTDSHFSWRPIQQVHGPTDQNSMWLWSSLAQEALVTQLIFWVLWLGTDLFLCLASVMLSLRRKDLVWLK